MFGLLNNSVVWIASIKVSRLCREAIDSRSAGAATAGDLHHRFGQNPGALKIGSRDQKLSLRGRQLQTTSWKSLLIFIFSGLGEFSIVFRISDAFGLRCWNPTGSWLPYSSLLRGDPGQDRRSLLDDRALCLEGYSRDESCRAVWSKREMNKENGKDTHLFMWVCSGT